MQAPVTASAVSATFGRPVVGALEAVAVVEPLGRAQVAVCAGGLDAAVGVEQHRPHHAGVVAVGRVLERLEPAAVRDHVVVEHDHVVTVTGVAPARG